MGADYSSHAVIGVRVSRNAFVSKQERTVDGCNHPHDFEFCPRCGRPAKRKEIVSVDLLEDDPDTFYGLDLVKGTDQREIYLGITCSGTNSNCGDEDSFVKVSDFQIREIRTKIQNVLRPLNLWDEKMFGLWSVLSCSY